MPEPDLPTLGEIVRRLEHISTQQAEILREIKADRIEAAKTYVRQDVYLSQRDMTNAIISDTRTDIVAVDGKVEADRAAYKSDRASDAANRRTLLFWLGTLTATVLLGIAGIIVTLAR